ncbi:hypothetical protein ALC56_12488 [Trachymyrmex septentrionalis]|uniref:Uncharacterized protein n=1 Tax=Trachymyrmex septentrionalis TaxID=34720 RepID=A0A195EXZ4_9HYME|nr:hypothetical protein ALC56_12488 [Trachymyrmex septentrionalis]
MGINPKKSSDPIIACLSITRPARNTDVLKIQRRAQLYRETPKSVAIRERRPRRGLEAFVSESVAEFVFRSAISPECGAVCKRI